MTETTSFTIEQFCKHASQGKLMGGKCLKCGKVLFPPRPICDNCFSKDFEWIDIPTKGKLLTYTIIHVPPAQFQSIAPYAVGIVQLMDGIRIPGMIKEAPLENVRIGMALSMVFEQCPPSGQWPQWPRYHFRPN